MSEPDQIERGRTRERAARRSSAAAAGRFQLLRARIAAVPGWLGATFEREMDRGRGFLWLPVLFAGGILIYYALPREPQAVALYALLALLVLATWLRRHRALSFRIAIAVAAIVAGLTAAKVRTDGAVAPVLVREMTLTLTGWIVGEEESANGGRRLVIRLASLERTAPAAMPLNVRVTVRTKAAALAVGDAISLKASLGPPPGPAMPGGYDFSFTPFYERIGAVGFAFGGAKPAALGPPPLSIRLSEPLAHFRDRLRQRVEDALPGDYGHIAAALIMGDQRGIDEDTQDAMRASGLGHILSISGLHLALVAGAVFWLLRALLALSPTLALTYPIKKWAAAGALLVATLYLGISGSEVATVRSWVMLAIMLGAILIDRRALTLRNVALAAIVILVVSPDSLLSISFQMSFAATIAVIATYEAFARRADRADSAPAANERNFLHRVRENLTTLFVTSLAAGLATLPFAAFYFQRVAPFTILANMATAPAIDFMVMPMAMLAVVAMPFGLEVFPLTAMKWGLTWMVAVADTTSSWSAGLGSVAMPPAAALLLMVAGFLWLALWRERWRLAGVIPILLALPLTFLLPRPAVLIDEDGATVAVRGDDGRFSIMGLKAGRFEAGLWLRADADARDTDAPDLTRGVACDSLGCTARLGVAGGAIVSLANRADAFDDDCRLASVVIADLDAPPGCDLHATVIDRAALGRFGAHALYREATGYRIETAYPATRRPFMPPARK